MPCSCRRATTSAPSPMPKKLLALVQHFVADLIVVDWMLRQDTDGLDLVHALRSVHPMVKTIMITGFPTASLEAARARRSRLPVPRQTLHAPPVERAHPPRIGSAPSAGRPGVPPNQELIVSRPRSGADPPPKRQTLGAASVQPSCPASAQTGRSDPIDADAVNVRDSPRIVSRNGWNP